MKNILEKKGTKKELLQYPSGEIDAEGFKINVANLIKNKLVPEYFNAPLIILWEITRACNLRCVHCYNNSGKKLSTELSHKKKIDIAKQIVKNKVFRVCLSGGEPILCESFWDIVDILTKGKVMCNTITNGYFIDEEVAKRFSKYFKFVQVSIDGATAKTHDEIRGVKGSWGRAINACKYLIDNGIKVLISFVATSKNIHEISKMIDLSYKLGAYSLRMDKVRLIGRAANNFTSIKPSKQQYIYMDRTIKKKQKEYKSKMIIEYTQDTQRAYIDHIMNIPNYLCYISPSGTCAPDPMLPFSGESLKEITFNSIWDSLKSSNKNPDFIKIIKSVKTNEDYMNLSEIPYVTGELHDK